MTNLIDANANLIVFETLITNTDIIGANANIKVIVAGVSNDGGTTFSNITHLVINYGPQINAIMDDVNDIRIKLDNLAANIASMTSMAANTGIKVIEAYSWISAATQAYFSLPYTLVSFNKQAIANTEDFTYPFPQEAYEQYNNSSANLVVLREIASNIPPFTTNTGGATIWALIAVGPNPPANAVANTLWWNSDEGEMYVYYNDGDTTQWVAT